MSTYGLRGGSDVATDFIDATIDEQVPTGNNGALNSLACDDYASGQEQRFLISPGGIVDIAGQTITAATFNIWLNSASVGTPSLTLYGVKRDWVEGDNSAGSGATWNIFDAGVTNWGTAGCDNTTSDRDSASSGSTTINTTTGEYKTITLNATGLAVLQDMADSGGNYFGFLGVTSAVADSGWRTYDSSQGATAAQRPYFDVTASGGGGGSILLPPSAQGLPIHLLAR